MNHYCYPTQNKHGVGNSTADNEVLDVEERTRLAPVYTYESINWFIIMILKFVADFYFKDAKHMLCITDSCMYNKINPFN